MVANILPNSNWQLATQYTPLIDQTSAMNRGGTELQPQVDIYKFDTGSDFPRLYTTDTRELYNGALVVFGPGHEGLSGFPPSNSGENRNWALRVSDLRPNESFKVKLPFSARTAAKSTPQTAFAVGTHSRLYGDQTLGPDGGWRKHQSLLWWIDDFFENRCPGAKRVLGLRKLKSEVSNFWWQCPTRDVASLRGRRITFGALVRMKSRNSSGTARLFISDDTRPPKDGSYSEGGEFSAFLRGPEYNNLIYGSYEFVFASRIISDRANQIWMGLETHGAANDIYYLATPTAQFRDGMGVEDCGQNIGEHIHAETHWNPPCLRPWGWENRSDVPPVPYDGFFPGAEIVPGSGLYGWSDFDVAALSIGQVHHSVSKVNCKIEMRSPVLELVVWVGALNPPEVRLRFGVQVETQVENRRISSNMAMVPLMDAHYPGGAYAPGCFAMFSNVKSGKVTNITFDFDDVMA